MAQVIFLSEQTLKQGSILSDNVDMKVVKPTILDVQQFFILPILGTSLFNAISDAIEAFYTDATPIETKYKTLLDTYITPCMIWYCRAELPLVLNYKFFNKAVGTQSADNMQAASMDELQTLMDHAKNKAEWYGERLTKFLLSNQPTYPLYLSQVDVNIDTIFAKNTNYTNGMVLGDNRCCRGEYNFRGIKTSIPFFNKDCNDC